MCLLCNPKKDQDHLHPLLYSNKENTKSRTVRYQFLVAMAANIAVRWVRIWKYVKITINEMYMSLCFNNLTMTVLVLTLGLGLERFWLPNH